MGVAAVEVQAKGDHGNKGGRGDRAADVAHKGKDGGKGKGRHEARERDDDAASAAADRREREAALERQIAEQQKGQIREERRETRQIEHNRFGAVFANHDEERADERKERALANRIAGIEGRPELKGPVNVPNASGPGSNHKVPHDADARKERIERVREHLAEDHGDTGKSDEELREFVERNAYAATDS
jgi:hypothetical protein